MNEILNLPAIGLVVSIAAYSFGVFICEKYRITFLTPLLIGIIVTITVIVLTPLSVENYQAGGDIIALFILPATVVLAITVYEQRAVLAANWLPILAGCIAGSITSILSIKLMGSLLGLDEVLIKSLLPKSVTTAIALELSEKNGGVPAITVIAISISGIGTSIIGPVLIKWFKLKDPVAAGCAMGMAGHAIGTARSIQLGGVQGGMAGISLCIAGIITSILFLMPGI